VSRTSTISKSTTEMVGEWHGDGLDIKNQAAAASSTCPSRPAQPRCRPSPRPGLGLHRDLPGQRGRLATCCRPRPQRRPYRNWPDRPVWPRVRREGGDAVQAVAGQGARFGDSVTYCRDDRADHREPYGVRARGRKAHGVACSPARAISSGRGARRTKPLVARSPAGSRSLVPRQIGMILGNAPIPTA
jgi:hypothetical protein